jgi:hypothetical protein
MVLLRGTERIFKHLLLYIYPSEGLSVLLRAEQRKHIQQDKQRT